MGHPPQPPAHPGPGPENAQAKPSSLFRKQGLRCEIQLVKKKSPAEQKQQTESSEPPQVLCPSPTCSPFSGGCNYVSQGFLSGSFFFLFFFPPPLHFFLSAAEQIKPRRGNQRCELAELETRTAVLMGRSHAESHERARERTGSSASQRSLTGCQKPQKYPKVKPLGIF